MIVRWQPPVPVMEAVMGDGKEVGGLEHGKPVFPLPEKNCPAMMLAGRDNDAVQKPKVDVRMRIAPSPVRVRRLGSAKVMPGKPRQRNVEP